MPELSRAGPIYLRTCVKLRAVELNHHRSGSGEPLVLVHGIGSEWAIWEPLIEPLSREFDVIAVDMPGFGESPPLPAHVAPHESELAEAVAEFVAGLGIERAHYVGNSLGGWASLALAKRGKALSVTCFCAAGLWETDAPLLTRVQLRMTRATTRNPRTLRWISRALETRLGRLVLLSGQFGHPSRVPAAAAIRSSEKFGSAPDFERVFEAHEGRRFSGGRGIDVPVTVVWGQRDRVISPSMRQLTELPVHARVLTLRGAGHVLMWDEPQRCVQLVRETAAAARLPAPV